MSNSDAFALQNSGLNEFLFAEVGTEANGSTLTILSLLARLGKDPWAEAARLARLPKSATVDYLVAGLSQMPLYLQDHNDAKTTAARVILLLPGQPAVQTAGISLPAGARAIPKWLPMALFVAVVACGIAYEAIQTATPDNSVTALADKKMGPPSAPTN